MNYKHRQNWGKPTATRNGAHCKERPQKGVRGASGEDREQELKYSLKLVAIGRKGSISLKAKVLGGESGFVRAEGTKGLEMRHGESRVSVGGNGSSVKKKNERWVTLQKGKQKGRRGSTRGDAELTGLRTNMLLTGEERQNRERLFLISPRESRSM